MNELIREIEEDIRRERFDHLWQSFGKVMVGVSLAIILATIVVEVVQHHKKSVAMESTTTFLKGIDRLGFEDYKSAISTFGALENDPSSPYYGLFMLRKAQAETATSDKDSAIKTYSALAANDPVFGKLAVLLVPASANEKNDALPELSKKSAFYYTNAEWRAWDLWSHDKKDEAITQFLSLYNDPATPASMHGRISEVLHYVAPDKLPVETSDARDLSHE